MTEMRRDGGSKAGTPSHDIGRNDDRHGPACWGIDSRVVYPDVAHALDQFTNCRNFPWYAGRVDHLKHDVRFAGLRGRLCQRGGPTTRSPGIFVCAY